MRIFPLIALSALLLASCASINSTSRKENQRVEVLVHKVRTDLEELKQDVTTQRMEVHLLEGKLLNQEDMISSVKEEKDRASKGAAAPLDLRIKELEAQFKRLEGEMSQMISDVKQLGGHAGQTTKALSQYKDKIAEMEKNLSIYGQSMRELAKVRKNLGQLNDNNSRYIVKAGDSLEKIARAHRTTISKIKDINRLNSDKIVVGQELLVPVR